MLLNNNLSGFEFLACIPGTVGGGIKMNAGCFDSEIKGYFNFNPSQLIKMEVYLTIPS